MTRRNAEHSQEAAGLMVAVDGQVGESNQALNEMVGSMVAAASARITSSVAKVKGLVEEVSAASEELNARAEASMTVVKRLELLVGGSGERKAPKAKRHAKESIGMLKASASVVPMRRAGR